LSYRITVLAALAAICVAAPAAAADREATDRVVAASGVAKLHGQDVFVEVLVAVPAGASAKAHKERALAEQGAKPSPQEYSATGLIWDVLPVRQFYNGAGERVAAETLLRNTHPTWSNVSGSRFGFAYGGRTTRCPSLVRECKGPQFNDGFNDVGWTRLGGSTLGVTWSTSGTDEADMAINTSFTWSVGCTQQAGAYDLQSVILHENGHVAGLGHSSDRAAVMYPSYQTARCALGADDAAGIRALYPS
jgi:Matrixin